MPVLDMRKALQDMGAGILTVLVDNEAASQNVARAAAKLGCEVAVQQVGRDFVVRIEKRAVDGVEERDGAASTATVVWIPTRTVGRGNDELGAALMRAFLYTVTQQSSPPTRVVFANRGVELCCEGSDALESVKALERAGAEVLACGMCLDFLGLTDKLCVGRVSNMAEIVEALSEADKLITV